MNCSFLLVVWFSDCHLVVIRMQNAHAQVYRVITRANVHLAIMVLGCWRAIVNVC